MLKTQWDFSGYATKNDLECTDGRVIKQDAFKHNDGQTVPLVWQHSHNDPTNVLGHAQLENRTDGVYAYCSFNSSDNAKHAAEMIKHGDVNSLSIYANGLVQNGNEVVHGTIREVSLVLSGANPGAVIENFAFQHSDGSLDELEDEAIIKMGATLEHSNNSDTSTDKENEVADDKTVGEVLDTLTEEQRTAVQFIIGQIMKDHGIDPEDDADESMKQSSYDGEDMSRNVFDNTKDADVEVLSHDAFASIVEDAKQVGSFKDAFMAHAKEYGISNIELLFPDARKMSATPDWINNVTDWVPKVLGATHHNPFSRIKMMHADIREDDARAKGYITGKRKKEEVFKLLKRSIDPTTIYKKQKFDRDDLVDITDLDVVAWVKAEMRMKLDEELARAVLIGDGREPDDEDKINEEKLIPIAKDDELYAIQETLPTTDDPEEIVDAIQRARTKYRGTGKPSLYISSAMLTEMMLSRDGVGHRMYKTEQELADTLRVADIVEVDLFDQTELEQGHLVAIMVNLTDYTIGADKGGEVNMFDDFDIDYNQYKYLIETRCSGALTKPFSAVVFTTSASGSDDNTGGDDPADPSGN